jgi:sorbitol-specific phosphotransferase system component IIA
VCESHAKQLGRSREHCPDVRIITDQPNRSDNPVKSEDRTEIREVAGTKPNGSSSSEAARSPADTAVGPAPVRDLTYGNSAKAMVDEVIWNMATGNYQVYRTALQQGKSATEAAQAAGGQLAVVHRKISDYTLKLEAVLSESKAIINVGEAIDKPLEHAVLEIISNGAMSDLEKDAAIQQLGALQEWVKHGLQGDITPLQANRIILAIGDRLNWGGTAHVSEEFKPVYRTLYCSLKTAIGTAVPKAQNLHDRLTNLYAAKSDLEVC